MLRDELLFALELQGFSKPDLQSMRSEFCEIGYKELLLQVFEFMACLPRDFPSLQAVLDEFFQCRNVQRGRRCLRSRLTLKRNEEDLGEGRNCAGRDRCETSHGCEESSDSRQFLTQRL